MPVALAIALAASLGIHFAALFGPEVDLSTEPESLPLVAELRPLTKSQMLPKVDPIKKHEKQKTEKNRSLHRKTDDVASTAPVLSVPEAGAASVPVVVEDAAPEPISSPKPALAVVEPRLPPHGMIRYRVDRGDSNFEIGVSRNEWEIDDGHYRLKSVIETTGLVWLFKAYRIEMESIGQMTPEGLRPESFAIRRNAKETKEKVLFDWQNMIVSVGEQSGQMLTNGAQDLLSFNYQLGYLPHPEAGGTLPIATGRKYGIYRLEVLGDEEIQVPAGTLRTLHLRAPGENTTELWLAYDYLLLPVKIRHIDSKGESLVQVATEIQLGNK